MVIVPVVSLLTRKTATGEDRVEEIFTCYNENTLNQCQRSSL